MRPQSSPLTRTKGAQITHAIDTQIDEELVSDGSIRQLDPEEQPSDTEQIAYAQWQSRELDDPTVLEDESLDRTWERIGQVEVPEENHVSEGSVTNYLWGTDRISDFEQRLSHEERMQREFADVFGFSEAGYNTYGNILVLTEKAPIEEMNVLYWWDNPNVQDIQRGTPVFENDPNLVGEYLNKTVDYTDISLSKDTDIPLRVDFRMPKQNYKEASDEVLQTIDELESLYQDLYEPAK